jgi:hypothetical protein
MRSMRLAIATAVCLSFAPAVQAQDTMALAEEYVQMPEVQQMITEMFGAEAMAAQFKVSLPPGMPLTDDQALRIGTLMSGVMNKMRPRIETLMTEASAKHFSVEELQALIDFYKSEHGASVMLKMQPYMQDVMGSMMPEMMTAMGEIGPQINAIMSGQ